MNPDKSAKAFNKLLRKPAVEAAQEILDAVLADKRRLLIGGDAVIVDLAQRLLPTGYQKLATGLTKLTKRFEPK